MAFGKRTTAEPFAPDASETAETFVSIEGIGAVRTRVTNPGGMDHKFIALAAGVVILSAGAAIGAPSLLSAFSGGMRPIKEVVAGLDRQQARNALALEAFPDADGAAFMTSLATHYPKSHGRLLDALADSAMAGGGRDELYLAVGAWSMNFGTEVLPAVSRSGAEGFDKGVALLNDGLHLVEGEAGGCTARKLQTYFQNPNNFADLMRYGSNGYHFSMRATRDFVELAAKGRNARVIDVRLNANDMNALQSTFFSLLADPQVSSLIQMSAADGMTNSAMQEKAMDQLNLCQLGRAVVIKLEKLPAATKARLWGTMLSGDPGMLTAAQGFASPFGGGMPDFSSSGFNFRP